MLKLSDNMNNEPIFDIFRYETQEDTGSTWQQMYSQRLALSFGFGDVLS